MNTMSYLLNNADGMGSIFWIIIILGVVALMVFSSFRNKKDLKARDELNNSIKKGVRVITASGVYGTVESVSETTSGKVVLLSSGEGNKRSYLEVHINAIAGVDNKQPVILDENGVDITNYEMESADKILEDINKTKSDSVEKEKEKEKPKTKTKKEKTV